MLVVLMEGYSDGKRVIRCCEYELSFLLCSMQGLSIRVNMFVPCRAMVCRVVAILLADFLDEDVGNID